MGRTLSIGLAIVAGVGAARAQGQVATPVPTAWQLLDDGDPAPLVGVGVYDAVRQRAIVLHDGMDGGNGPSLHWELNGEDWVRRFLAAPTAMSSACATFDTTRGRVVVFGAGITGAVQTWEFDGAQWVQRFPATSPPARFNCSVAYDPTIQRTVLFGGYAGGTIGLGDTWEWDGASWTQVQPAASPVPRGESAMVYDVAAGRITLFGGRNGNGYYGDTWQYDGRKHRWVQKTPATVPPGRAGPGLAYDPVRQIAVMFGGVGLLNTFADTWEWNGTNWTQRSPSQSPSPRWNFRMMYDTARSRVLGWGGNSGDGWVNDTWAYDGTTWAPTAVSGLPRSRSHFGMAYDPTRAAIVMLGGETAAWPTPHNWSDTWLYTNGHWSSDPNAGMPSATQQFPLTFDPFISEVRGFSGSNLGALPSNADVHGYAGSPGSWLSIPTCCPDPRVEHGWVSAPALGGTILFGGRACCDVTSALYQAQDTWLLDGSGWTQKQPTHVPGKRMWLGMTYEDATAQVLLYGGSPIPSAAGSLADTWLFDGLDWTLVQDPSPPGPRVAMGLTFDSARRRAVLFGGGPLSELVTWEFDGVAWIARPTAKLPDPTRVACPLAYDSNNQIVFLFGGRDLVGEIYFNDTWAYGPDPDGDGIVGGLDNCPNAANVNQANDDADVAGNVCDCAPVDPGTWSAPQPVGGLLVSGTGTTALTWLDQSAVVGPGVRYDVATGDLIALQSTGSYAGATCLVDQTAVPSTNDARSPGPASGFWYLVRARNVCGLGTYGAPALDGASPCP